MSKVLYQISKKQDKKMLYLTESEVSNDPTGCYRKDGTLMRKRRPHVLAGDHLPTGHRTVVPRSCRKQILRQVGINKTLNRLHKYFLQVRHVETCSTLIQDMTKIPCRRKTESQNPCHFAVAGPDDSLSGHDFSEMIFKEK